MKCQLFHKYQLISIMSGDDFSLGAIEEILGFQAAKLFILTVKVSPFYILAVGR